MKLACGSRFLLTLNLICCERFSIGKVPILYNSLIISTYEIGKRKRVTIWLLLKFPELPWFAVVSNNSFINAKINKMCCPTKENICFFLVGQTFLLSFRWFNCLAEILLIFGRNKLCPLFVNFAIGHNTFLPFMTDEKRQGAACRKGFRQICFLPLFCVSAILSKVWISARQFFRFFFFDVFPSLGGGSKSRIVCRRRSRSYSGGDKSLTRLPPTPPTCLTKP